MKPNPVARKAMHVPTFACFALALASCTSTSSSSRALASPVPTGSARLPAPETAPAAGGSLPTVSPVHSSAVAEPTEPLAPLPAASLASLQEVTFERPFQKDRLLLYRLDVGVRQFEGSWEPVDQPLVLGAGLHFEPSYWPLGIEAGVSYSTSDDDKDGSGYRSTSLEFTFGGSKSFWPVEDTLILTLGGGLAITRTKDRVDVFTPPATTQRFSGSDWWGAFYLHSRLAWKFSPVFDVGLDLRGMSGQSVSTVGGVRGSSSGQLLLSFGFHR